MSSEERSRRYADNKKVYSAETSPLERKELLKRYGVSYLLFDRERTSPGLMNELIKLGKPVGGTLKLSARRALVRFIHVLTAHETKSELYLFPLRLHKKRLKRAGLGL